MVEQTKARLAATHKKKALKQAQRPKPNSLAGCVEQVEQQLGTQLISAIYRERIRPLRTRSFALSKTAKSNAVEILHTLLGIELKIGNRRIACPDLSTARYLAVFARLGVAEVAVPYDITGISQFADELESSWYRMLALVEHFATAPEEKAAERLRKRVRKLLIERVSAEIAASGAGPAIPEFIQNTKQRRPNK